MDGLCKFSKLSNWALVYPRGLHEGAQALQGMAKMHLSNYESEVMDGLCKPQS